MNETDQLIISSIETFCVRERDDVSEESERERVNAHATFMFDCVEYPLIKLFMNSRIGHPIGNQLRRDVSETVALGPIGYFFLSETQMSQTRPVISLSWLLIQFEDNYNAKALRLEQLMDLYLYKTYAWKLRDTTASIAVEEMELNDSIILFFCNRNADERWFRVSTIKIWYALWSGNPK